MNISNLLKDNIVSKEEALLLYIIYENEQVNIKVLSQISPEPNILKKDLMHLLERKYIDIDWNANIVNKPYKKPHDELTVSDVDRVRVIINREIALHELEQLKKWQKKYSIDKIVNAFYKAAVKNIDNFNYIEKVLENDPAPNNKKSEQNKVRKNFDFFS